MRRATSNHIRQSFDNKIILKAATPQHAPKVREINQLRPLVSDQPWGFFHVNFDAKHVRESSLSRRPACSSTTFSPDVTLTPCSCGSASA